MMSPTVVGGPVAWRSAELTSSEYEYHLAAAQIESLVGEVRGVVGDGMSRPLTDITSDDIPLEKLDDIIADVLDDIRDGRGFALIRGIPVEDMTVTEAEVALWAIGRRIGIPMPQNPDGDVLIHVRDQGRRFSDPKVRAYETSEQLEYHTDSGDIVGLLCLRPARQGGVSTIVSAVAIHDEMVRRAPELASALHEPWWRVSLLEGKVHQKPICDTLDERIFFGYGRMYLERASQQRPDLIPPLSDRQVAALDLFDELANSDEFRLDMHFAPGDIQLLNNYVILHARTEYEDWPEPERHRDLCRLWLVREDLVLPTTFVGGGIVSRDVVLEPNGPTSDNPQPSSVSQPEKSGGSHDCPTD